MTVPGLSQGIFTALGHRLAARRAVFAKPAQGFVSQPEPRTIGDLRRGKQLVAGSFLMAGHLIEGDDILIWSIPAPDAGFTAATQGFGWLDDLAAVGDAEAQKRAQDWTWAWIKRFGRGRGPGWTPDLTGRRVIRMINHALFLLEGRTPAESEAFYAVLAAQTRFLARRFGSAPPGMPRFEAITGLIYAGLALTGMEDSVKPAIAVLAEQCRTRISADGALPTRNPEELSEIFSLLIRAAQALGEAGMAVPVEVHDALERIAPTLRALRHADGGLARFHGGDRGLRGQLEAALVSSGVKVRPAVALAMGYARLSGGRTSVIADAAAPAAGRAGDLVHASTLAFELTSGRRPVIVSSGSGAPFGRDWQKAGRATASHSTLTLDNSSSSRLGAGAWGREALVSRAQVTLCQPQTFKQSQGVLMAHDGWVQTLGLTHGRELVLSSDGRKLTGQDELMALTPKDKARMKAAVAREGLRGLRYAIRFHLHPEARGKVDPGGNAVSILLRSGEIWVFRHDPGPVLTLEASVYMEPGRLQPRTCQQIVLSGKVSAAETRVDWTLAKAQDTPLAIRDVESDDD